MYEALAPVYDHIYPHEELLKAFSTAMPALLDRLGTKSRLRVLDLCCGTGRALSLFADMPQAELHGVDSNETMLQTARINFPAAHFKLQDVRELSKSDFEGKEFDLVLIFGLGLQHFADADRMHIFQNVANLLRLGGLLIFDIVNTASTAAGPGAVIRNSFLVDDHRITVIYVRHYEGDKIHQYDVVIKTAKLDNDPPQLDQDNFVLYQLSAEEARSEASQANLRDVGPLSVGYSRATYLCVSRA
jgi:SAM-dependent methyltransferase